MKDFWESNWPAVVQGAAGGIVAAALLAIFALFRYRVSDRIFRWRLRWDLREILIGQLAEGPTPTIHIRNRVGKTFTARSLVVITDKDYYATNPTSDISATSKEEYSHG